MEYVYAALLLHNSGKEITEDSVSAIMDAAGIEADKGKIKGLISALREVNIDEAMAQALPVYAPVAAPLAQAPAAAPAAEPAKEKEEKKEEEKAEETSVEGLAALFG
ncbi:MAG: 50S ribosomal protein P1 [Halobacteriota archaeon]